MLPDGDATALVWDFGGQEIMHGTHQFFLSHRSLYLVVLDGRHDRAKQDAEYWLKLPLEGEPETELVPELLPDETPPFANWNGAESLVFLYQYTVLPYGVLPRFITRTHAKSRGRYRWRSGVVLAREQAEAVVRADYDKNQVIVWVRGQDAGERRDLLTVVRDHFSAIHGQIKGLNPQELRR
jgi:GTPase SAR1 family protein